MSDVLCDFCHRPWTEDIPMIEGHQGSCICGKCLRIAYLAVVTNGESVAPAAFNCTLCLEGNDDREAQSQSEHIGWQSPAYEEAVICRRCIKQAAGALHKDRDTDWSKPDRV